MGSTIDLVVLLQKALDPESRAPGVVGGTSARGLSFLVLCK